MRLRQRDQPAGAAVAADHAGLSFEFGDLVFQRKKGIELELLLVVPLVGHMRHQGAEQTAARPLSQRSRIDKQGSDTEALCLDRRPQPHDAATKDDEIGRRWEGMRLTAGAGRIIRMSHERP